MVIGVLFYALIIVMNLLVDIVKLAEPAHPSRVMSTAEANLQQTGPRSGRMRGGVWRKTAWRNCHHHFRGDSSAGLIGPLFFAQHSGETNDLANTFKSPASVTGLVRMTWGAISLCAHWRAVEFRWRLDF